MNQRVPGMAYIRNPNMVNEYNGYYNQAGSIPVTNQYSGSQKIPAVKMPGIQENMVLPKITLPVVEDRNTQQETNKKMQEESEERGFPNKFSIIAILIIAIFVLIFTGFIAL